MVTLAVSESPILLAATAIAVTLGGGAVGLAIVAILAVRGERRGHR
ncbi:hypothetical protein [Sphingomonas solaris]|nr:hypothetical protein [Sphingomonas solaris]